MQTYVDLRNIFETVNNEFSKRIEETLTAKRSLEKELARVSSLLSLFLLASFISQVLDILILLEIEEYFIKIIVQKGRGWEKAKRY